MILYPGCALNPAANINSVRYNSCDGLSDILLG